MTFTYEYPRPSVTLDAAVVKVPTLKKPEILLIRRGNEPFKNLWALPGGFLDMHETPLTGAARELLEETGLADLPLKPLFTCGEPGRDPRGRTITMVYGCLIRDTATTPQGSDDAAEAGWFPITELPEMAFDHGRVIAQIHASLLWQARHTIIGQNVFHDLASERELITLHVNLCGPGEGKKAIARAISAGLLKCRDGICEFFTPVPAGPDWHPMVW